MRLHDVPVVVAVVVVVAASLSAAVPEGLRVAGVWARPLPASVRPKLFVQATAAAAVLLGHSLPLACCCQTAKERLLVLLVCLAAATREA
jgi:hypothetical protein